MFSTDKILEVRIPVSASIAAAVSVMALTVAFWYATKSWSQTVLFFVGACAAFGAVLSAFYAARSLSLTAAALDRSERRARQAIAFQFTSKWNDPTMFHVRDAIRKVFHYDHKSKEFADHIHSNETNIIHFLNLLEEIAIAMEIGEADPNILELAFKGVVTTSWNKLQNWVGDFRQVRGRPAYWINVEKLAQKWR